MKGFFAVVGNTANITFDNSTLENHYDTWGNATANLTLQNASTFKGHIRFTAGATSAIMNISFEDSTYNTGHSVQYLSATNDGTLNMSFLGSNNDIYMNTVEIREGVLSFKGDAGGFTLFNASTFTLDKENVSLDIDFSDVILTGNETRFDILTSDNDISDYIGLTTNFTLKNKTDFATLGYDNATSTLYVTYSIPEPSTYAMIFGALALAFVTYRRRK